MIGQTWHLLRQGCQHSLVGGVWELGLKWLTRMLWRLATVGKEESVVRKMFLIFGLDCRPVLARWRMEIYNTWTYIQNQNGTQSVILMEWKPVPLEIYCWTDIWWQHPKSHIITSLLCNPSQHKWIANWNIPSTCWRRGMSASQISPHSVPYGICINAQ